MEIVISDWVRKDSYEVADFIENLPINETRDYSIHYYSLSNAQFDIKVVREWAGVVHDDALNHNPLRS